MLHFAIFRVVSLMSIHYLLFILIISIKDKSSQHLLASEKASKWCSEEIMFCYLNS